VCDVVQQPSERTSPLSARRAPSFVLLFACAGGAVFVREFLLGDAKFDHRRFEVVVFEFLRRNTSVLLDLLGLALRHLVCPKGHHSADEHDTPSRDPPPSTTHHPCSRRHPSSPHAHSTPPLATTRDP